MAVSGTFKVVIGRLDMPADSRLLCSVQDGRILCCEDFIFKQDAVPCQSYNKQKQMIALKERGYLSVLGRLKALIQAMQEFRGIKTAIFEIWRR